MTDFYEDRGEDDWVVKATSDMVRAGAKRTNAWGAIWSSGINQLFNNQRTGVSGETDEDGNRVNTDVMVNYSWPAYMQEAATMAQRRPLIMVEPHDEQDEDDDSAKLWEGILQHQYLNALKMCELNNAASIDAYCYGIYIAKVFWEPKAEWDLKARQWIGKPQANLLYPPYFGADPEAETIDSSTSYLYSGRRVDLGWVLRRWGKTTEMKTAIMKAAESDPFNAEFMRDMNDSWGPDFSPHGVSEDHMASSFQREDASDLKNQGSRGRIVNMINSARGFGGSDDKDNRAGRPRKLTLFEIYFRDLTESQKNDVAAIDKEELIDKGALVSMDNGQLVVGNPEAFKKSAPHLKEGDVPRSIDMPMRTDQAYEPDFPRGRFVIKIGEELVLNPDPADQVYPYRQWPYVTGVLHELPHIWEGMNGSEMSENLQTFTNSTYTAMLNLIKYHGDPTLITDKSNLADPKEDIETGPAKIINAAPGQIDKVAKYLDRAGMPSEAFSIAELLDRHIQGQSGKHDQSMGKASKADVTATEIAAKQEADIVRSSLQIQRRDRWIKTIMELVVELDQANLEPGQIVQMTGKEFDARRGEMTQALKDLEFSIKLQIGTGLPFDKQQKKNDLIQLSEAFGSPFPFARELLEAFEIDNIDELLEKVDGYPQFLQFMEQLQAQEEEAAQEQEQAGSGPV